MTRVTVGEVWKLGRHLLTCGSSFDDEVVDKVMGGGWPIWPS